MVGQAEREHGPAAERQQDQRGGTGQYPRPRPRAPRTGWKAGRLRETIRAERPCARDDQAPVRGRRRAGVRHQPEQLIPQGRRQQRHREHAEQHGRAQLAPFPLPAVRAVLDVPVDPLAEQDGQLAVPAVQDGGQVRAGLLAGPGHQQGAQRGLELGAGPGRQRMGLVARHPQRGSQVIAVQFMPEVQLDDLALTGVEPAQRRADQPAQVVLLGAGADGRGVVGQVPGLLQRAGGGPLAETAPAFVPGHGVQPGPQPVGVAQAAQLRRRDDEGVLHRVGGIRRLAQHRGGERVQRPGVAVVGGRKTAGVARHNGGHDLAVLHALTVEPRPPRRPAMPGSPCATWQKPHPIP